MSSETGPQRHNPAPLAFALMRVGRIVEAEIERSAGRPKLTVAQAKFLQLLILVPEGLTPTLLAERSYSTQASVTQMLERLLASDVITRAPNPEDARSTIVKATAFGRSEYELVEASVTTYDETLAKRFGPEEAAGLLSRLSSLAE